VSALADALAAAQSRAVAALGKQYVGGATVADAVRIDLEAIGLTDELDTARLLAAWDILRAAGAQAPGEQRAATNGEPKPEDKATDAQLALIAKLVAEKKAVPPDLPITKTQAHEIIDTLKAGTYDADRWSIPFE
jgi:hypothetical protein